MQVPSRNLSVKRTGNKVTFKRGRQVTQVMFTVSCQRTSNFGFLNADPGCQRTCNLALRIMEIRGQLFQKYYWLEIDKERSDRVMLVMFSCNMLANE